MKKGDIYKLKADYPYGKLMPKDQIPGVEHYDDTIPIPAGTLVEIDVVISHPFVRRETQLIDGVQVLVDAPGSYDEVEFKIHGKEEPFFWIGSHHGTLGDWIADHVELVSES